MEEVDIKALWNKGKSQASKEDLPNLDEIASKKSRTPLYWIKVVLWIEFWFNLVSLPVIYIFYRELDPILYGVAMPIIIFIYLIYYQFLIQSIRRFDYNIDVKSGLKKIHGYLNFFFLHYKVIIWVSVFFGYFYEIYLRLNESKEAATQEEWLKIIGFGILVCGIVGLLLGFLIDLIYGRKIKRIKKIVDELDEHVSEE